MQPTNNASRRVARSQTTRTPTKGDDPTDRPVVGTKRKRASAHAPVDTPEHESPSKRIKPLVLPILNAPNVQPPESPPNVQSPRPKKVPKSLTTPRKRFIKGLEDIEAQSKPLPVSRLNLDATKEKTMSSSKSLEKLFEEPAPSPSLKRSATQKDDKGSIKKRQKLAELPLSPKQTNSPGLSFKTIGRSFVSFVGGSSNKKSKVPAPLVGSLRQIIEWILFDNNGETSESFVSVIPFCSIKGVDFLRAVIGIYEERWQNEEDVKSLVLLLNFWLTNQNFDKRGNEVTILKTWIDRLLSDNFEEASNLLLQTFKFGGPTLSTPRPRKPIKSSDTPMFFLLREYSAKEIAEQLTYIDSVLYGRVQTNDLFSMRWSKDPFSSPHLAAVFDRWNMITRWVVSECVFSPKERKKNVKKFVEIAEELENLKNFHCLMAFVAGLCSSLVERLEVWKAIPKVKATKERLEGLMGADGNFASYRERLRKVASSGTPYVPYLGVLTKDLTALFEGGFKSAEAGNGCYNFQKIEMLQQFMGDWQRFQKDPVKVKEEKGLVKKLVSVFVFDEDALWEIPR